MVVLGIGLGLFVALRCPAPKIDLRMDTNARSDPRPQPPAKPLPQECCESGCPICVYDLYAEALDGYRQALEAWKSRHPDADGDTLPT